MNLKSKWLGLVTGISLLGSCTGEESGGIHMTIAINGTVQSTAIVYYVDANCQTLSGTTIVGSTYEACPNSTVLETVFSCADIPIGFSQFNDCTDVTLSPATVGTNFQILNDCRGIMSGNLQGDSGSCWLALNDGACECQVDTSILATAHNQAFATKVTEGIAILRAATSAAKDKIFEGLANPDQAEFEPHQASDGPNYIFACDLF